MKYNGNYFKCLGIPDKLTYTYSNPATILQKLKGISHYGSLTTDGYYRSLKIFCILL